jgi:hypothetical protein
VPNHAGEDAANPNPRRRRVRECRALAGKASGGGPGSSCILERWKHDRSPKSAGAQDRAEAPASQHPRSGSRGPKKRIRQPRAGLELRRAAARPTDGQARAWRPTARRGRRAHRGSEASRSPPRGQSPGRALPRQEQRRPQREPSCAGPTHSRRPCRRYRLASSRQPEARPETHQPRHRDGERDEDRAGKPAPAPTPLAQAQQARARDRLSEAGGQPARLLLDIPWRSGGKRVAARNTTDPRSPAVPARDRSTGPWPEQVVLMLQRPHGLAGGSAPGWPPAPFRRRPRGRAGLQARRGAEELITQGSSTPGSRRPFRQQTDDLARTSSEPRSRALQRPLDERIVAAGPSGGASRRKS